jgi:hypothetical protein
MGQQQDAKHVHQHFAEKGSFHNQQTSSLTFKGLLVDKLPCPDDEIKRHKGMQSTPSPAVPIAWFIDDLPYNAKNNIQK